MTRTAMGRRRFLASTISFTAFGAAASAANFAGGTMPWVPDQTHMPRQINPGPWTYLTADEAVALGALADRLIPADELSPGAKDCGVVTYIDGQLNGGFGDDDGLYMQAPFMEGLPGQGPQSPITPKQRYRQSLAALANYCHAAYAGKVFADIPAAEQDKVIKALEDDTLPLGNGVHAKAFFQLLWQNVKEGFFADPIYGGNRDMAGWRMIGFGGARYDYRNWIDKHNQPYPLPPVGIADHPDWVPNAPTQA